MNWPSGNDGVAFDLNGVKGVLVRISADFTSACRPLGRIVTNLRKCDRYIHGHHLPRRLRRRNK